MLNLMVVVYNIYYLFSHPVPITYMKKKKIEKDTKVQNKTKINNTSKYV